MLKPETYKKYADILRGQPARDLDAMPGRARYSREAEQPKKPAMSLAQEIISVGERVRNGGFQPPALDKNSLAGQIIEAGKRRRGEPV